MGRPNDERDAATDWVRLVGVVVVVGVVVAVGVAVGVVVAVGVAVGVAVVVGVGVAVGVGVGVGVVVGVAGNLIKGVKVAKLVSPLSVGRAVLVRTVTLYYTGRIASIKAGEVVLTDAAWIADTGRFHNALRDGTLSEVEPFVGPVSINRGSIIDVTEWKHALPREQK